MNTTYSIYKPDHITIAGLLYVGAVIEHNAYLYEVTAIKRGRFMELEVQKLDPNTPNALQSTMVYERKEYLVYTKI